MGRGCNLPDRRLKFLFSVFDSFSSRRTRTTADDCASSSADCGPYWPADDCANCSQCGCTHNRSSR